MDPSTVEPLSVGVQIGLRVPVILVALAGVLLALLIMRRLGALAGILAAAGSLLIAADQAANIVWILHLRSMTSGGDLDIDTFNSVNNAYVVADSNHGYKMIGVGALVAKELLGEPQALLAPFRFGRYRTGELHPVSNSPFPWS